MISNNLKLNNAAGPEEEIAFLKAALAAATAEIAALRAELVGQRGGGPAPAAQPGQQQVTCRA